jgi:acyl-coenzyme A thioesterase PaaI-like protein
MGDLVMTAAELEAFLHSHMPAGPTAYRVERSDLDGLLIRAPFHDGQLRPGGTVSGPTLMALADAAAWLVTLARIGPVELAVTSSLTIAFLAKPEPTDVLAHATLLRLGRRQSVSEVRLWSDGGTPDEPVAHATVTYAIPTPR